MQSKRSEKLDGWAARVLDDDRPVLRVVWIDPDFGGLDACPECGEIWIGEALR